MKLETPTVMKVEVRNVNGGYIVEVLHTNPGFVKTEYVITDPDDVKVKVREVMSLFIDQE